MKIEIKQNEDGDLVFFLSKQRLRDAAASCEYFWDGESGIDKPCVDVIDRKLFAKEIMYSINAEAEDGSTLLTRMLDKAIINAVEGGCEGIAYDD